MSLTSSCSSSSDVGTPAATTSPSRSTVTRSATDRTSSSWWLTSSTDPPRAATSRTSPPRRWSRGGLPRGAPGSAAGRHRPACVGRVVAREQLDKRRLAGSVLAHEPVDLAGPDGHARVAQGAGAPERLRQAPDLEACRGVRRQNGSWSRSTAGGLPHQLVRKLTPASSGGSLLRRARMRLRTQLALLSSGLTGRPRGGLPGGAASPARRLNRAPAAVSLEAVVHLLHALEDDVRRGLGLLPGRRVDLLEPGRGAVLHGDPWK